MSSEIDPQANAIAKSVVEIEISTTDAWADLDILSTHTTVDQIEVEPEGIIIKGDRFWGSANIYVTLQYGSDNDDGFTTSDSFVAEFEGEISDGAVTVVSFNVDTSPFYETSIGEE